MISIIIPNYNSGELLKKNLPKLFDLLEKSKLDYEVIITDDASTDNSLDELEEFTKQVNLVTSDKNTGFGTNVNRGIQITKGDFVFILNAIDILPENANYFSIMLKHFIDPKVFSVAAVKRDSESHGSGEIYFHRGLFMHRRGQQEEYTSWADGGAQAIRKTYYERIGGFDSLYKLYWEDVDLGFRAWKAGYIIKFEPKAILIHNKVDGPIAKHYTEEQRRTMNLRNQFIFTYKNSDLKYLLIHCIWLPYHIAVAFKNNDKSWFDAYGQAISVMPEIFKKRISQKKISKLSDDEFLLK